jgi:nucleotide-binding universal stress UspA family protein
MNTLSFLDIFHPADFSKANEGAFAHALKIGLAAKAKLTILHVEEPTTQVRWKKFPHVRKTLARWRILTEEASLKEVEKLGLCVKKVERIGTDPGKEILNYVGEHAPGLIVLATHQRKGMSRWMHAALAEPIARQAHVMTLSRTSCRLRKV